MRAEDITEQNSLVQSDQAEAVKNIEGGEFFSMRPDAFKQNKVELQPTVDYAKLPPVATPTVASFAAAEFLDECDSELRAAFDERRIDAALETVARVGIDLQLASGLRDGCRIEERDF